MKGLREKFQKNGGFTLVEMLIVVAIIAILVAVSIPMVSGALEKARHAVDEANYRNAAALGNIKVLSDAESAKGTYKYVVVSGGQGKLVESTDNTTDAVKAQCRCGNGPDGAKEGATLQVEIKDNDEVVVTWESSSP